MKRLLLFLMMVGTWVATDAANKKTTVSQVTTAVTLTDDVDYHISSKEPFTTTGSVDIVNTEHAVLILDNLRPTEALDFLSFVKINGEEAKNNSNCQVKVHGTGAIIMPYEKNFKPLTTFTGDNFDGESCNSYGTEQTGGYMNTLTEAKLNNKIRSFKLKRGYMVTFSVAPEGRGYSRCFIAADEDIAVKLPKIMAGRVSSYRIFPWRDVAKSGVVDFGKDDLYKTGSYWTYQWGAGSDYGIDFDCVPHMNHRYGPSNATLGGSTYSPNVKTDNEPGNSADPQPATVEEVLGRWEDLMRTGKRLMTPSSHDGSMNWFSQFLDAIDERGWRCEVLDFHCYWDEGQYNNLEWYANKYKRPIWISEFVWGASWNNNGIFSSEHNRDNPSQATLQKNKEVMGRILTRLNEWDHIERYCYWNAEANCSKIYRDGKLTPLGEFFAAMKPPVGYNGKYDYVPALPKVKAPYGLEIKYVASTSKGSLTWTEDKPELLDRIVIEVKIGKGGWQELEEVAIDELKHDYKWEFVSETPGNYTYRIHTVDYNNASHYSNEAYNIISGSELFDGTAVQVGTFATTNSSENTCFFAEAFKSRPVVVFGSVSNYNSNAGLVERIRGITYTNRQYKAVTMNIIPLTLGTQTDFYRTNTNEYTSYIVADAGRGTIGSLAYEATNISTKQVGKVVEYKFTEPFNEAPVVMATPIYPSVTYPIMWRVYDVTPEGCKIILQKQAGIEDNVSRVSAEIALFAIEKGRTTASDGRIIIVGDQEATFNSGSTLSQTIEYGETLTDPKVLVQLQTLNRNVAGALRTKIGNPDPDNTTVRLQLDYSDKANNGLSQNNPDVEQLGWIVIGTPEQDPDAVRLHSTMHQLVAYPSVVEQSFGLRDDSATSATIYSANGVKLAEVQIHDGQATVDASSLPAGIYVIRTNSNHSTKIIKR